MRGVSFALNVVAHQSGERVSKRGHRVLTDDHAVDTMSHERSNGWSSIHCDHRHATRQRFPDRIAEAFDSRR
jgi:hypothetical protein